MRYYRRLSDLGLAPEIVAVQPTCLATRLCVPLADWLGGGPSPAERRNVALRLYRQIDAMHDAGISHRDLHVGNVVLLDGMPLLIDPQFAIESDPSTLSYDLYGPGPSGVPVPKPHAEYPANRGGVWWDCTAEVPTLHEVFGPLVAILRT